MIPILNADEVKARELFNSLIISAEWNIFRGDRVEVLIGKDKGRQGIVKSVITERNWVIVDGLNCHYRKVGKDKDYPGIIIKSEAPLVVG